MGKASLISRKINENHIYDTLSLNAETFQSKLSFRLFHTGLPCLTGKPLGGLASFLQGKRVGKELDTQADWGHKNEVKC